MHLRWFTFAVVVTSVAACGTQGSGGFVEIQVLSNRADLLSGGDALVEIVLPTSADESELDVSVNGVDVRAQFARRPNGRIQGLIADLPLGESRLVANLRGGAPVEMVLTNHPTGGPVFAGPQVEPWVCRTEELGLGPATDKQCNAPSKVEFFYRAQDVEDFVPYDPSSPPADIAMTTTDAGVTVPYIVRREQGTLNRGIYSVAVLADPFAAVAPWDPPAAWNGKVYYPFGGGASPMHYQSGPDNVLLDMALSRGFVVATTSLNTFGNNSNSVVSAEAVMMLKEHITESFGPIRYTFATGSSGGAMQQQLITNAYPGLLDGIQPSNSFPDIWKNIREVNNCWLLLQYFNETAPGMWADVTERNAVMVNADELPGTCEAWVSGALPTGWGDPTVGCAPRARRDEPAVQTPAWIYSADANSTGTRCTEQDYQVAMFGMRGDGFANRPYDNIGVQYGLVALENGAITPEQFVDMNEKVGGLDIDYRWTAARSEADSVALDIVYRTGQFNLGDGMNAVPIIDNRRCRNVEVHSCYHTWVTRARIVDTHGHADNHVVLLNPPDAAVSFDLMDRWLAAIESDASSDTRADTVVRHRPSEAVDGCWIEDAFVANMDTCLEVNPYFGNAHLGAGQALGDGVLKCQVKPLDRDAYYVEFTDEQWSRLEQTFADGVCDWTQRGVGQTSAVPWLSFADGPGGLPLGDAPISEAVVD